MQCAEARGATWPAVLATLTNHHPYRSPRAQTESSFIALLTATSRTLWQLWASRCGISFTRLQPLTDANLLQSRLRSSAFPWRFASSWRHWIGGYERNGLLRLERHSTYR